MAILSAPPAILRIFTLVVVAAADIYGSAGLARLYGSQRNVAFARAYDFIRTELPPDAVILGDERVWLFTGRRVVGMAMPTEYHYLNLPDSQMEFFMGYKAVAHQFGAGYVLVGPWDGVHWDVPFDRAEQLAAAIRSDPDLERIFSQNGVELFRIRANGRGSP